MALDFPQQAQEPASSQGFFVPGRPLQQQPCDIPCNIPCNPADNISSNMNTPSLNSQHYCNPGYNTDFSIQPSVPLYQSFPLQSHGSYQQPPLTVESALAIMTNSVPSTNPGAYDFYIQPQGTPLMDNTTSPFQNYTPHDCLYLPAPTDRELLLLLQQQCMDVNSDSLVTDFAHTEEQRVTNILFTPPASPFLNSGEQMMPEPPKVSLAGRKRRGSDNHGQCGHKRPKKAIQIQKKLEIIKYWEQNQNVTFQKIGEYFGIPRTTIYGIVKVREELWAFDKNQPRASLTLETSRMVEPQLRILEEVLMTWITDLQSRCAPISGPKIIGQAFNIHRMLSGLLVEPLPPCKFTSGWLKNFKKRRHLSHKAMHREVTAPDEVERAFKEVRDEIAGYAINRIYTCGVTSMYLSTIPTAAFQNEGRNYQTNSVDSASVSVLFCSNADGSDKRKPLVLGTVRPSSRLRTIAAWCPMQVWKI
ncbi:hypothetical protein EDD21DRAFT_229668 [Dissophora ornata]|nr:hypothetical protein EDD21DRAFT_229668 [Dissophora ornata]